MLADVETNDVDHDASCSSSLYQKYRFHHIFTTPPTGLLRLPQRLGLRPPLLGPSQLQPSPLRLQLPRPLLIESPQRPLLAGLQQHPLLKLLLQRKVRSSALFLPLIA